jgi:hypothetical protein
MLQKAKERNPDAPWSIIAAMMNRTENSVADRWYQHLLTKWNNQRKRSTPEEGPRLHQEPPKRAAAATQEPKGCTKAKTANGVAAAVVPAAANTAVTVTKNGLWVNGMWKPCKCKKRTCGICKGCMKVSPPCIYRPCQCIKGSTPKSSIPINHASVQKEVTSSFEKNDFALPPDCFQSQDDRLATGSEIVNEKISAVPLMEKRKKTERERKR